MPETRITFRSLLLHLFALAAIVLLPSLVLDVPIWRIERIAKVYLLLAAAGYAACVISLMLRRPPEGRWAWLAAPVICGVILAPLSLLAALPASNGARTALFLALILAAVLLWTTHLLQQRGTLQTLGMLALGALGAAAAVAHVMLHLSRISAPAPSLHMTSLNSSLYPLRFSLYRFAVKMPRAQGGALGLLGDRFLLAAGDGDLYSFARVPGGGALDVQQLPYRIPLNLDEFATDAGPEVRLHQFRVADILVRERGETVQLYASHHFWQRARQCYVLRVSLLEGTRAQLLDSKAPLRWKTVYDTSPCLPLKLASGKLFFNGVAVGGRLALLDDTHLLLTAGDHEYDGMSAPIQYAQNPDTSYGKTLSIDLDTGTAAVYSLGHRNPQGLYIGSGGAIWSTEHGPQGGDELNLIERGKNYGWPEVTYGVDYGTHGWPNSEPGTHVGFERPRFAWVPSIGISNLVEVSQDLFARWKGDLMIGSLTGRALWRVRVRDGRVVLTERISLGERIRDLLEAPDGSLVVWTDVASIGFLEPEREPETGAGLFAAHCGGCHVVEDGDSHGIGPDLHAVLGRKIGGAAEFQYSPALHGKPGTWTDEKLDAFLASPASFAPGTSMRFPGLPDPASRQKIIAFLAGRD